MPKHIQMESTNNCNLQCVECPNRFMKRKRTYMSSEVFLKILDDYAKFYNVETMIMHKDGEPLLHPHIKSMLWEINNQTKAKMDIYTNGLLLKQNFVKFLSFMSNPKTILISFHFYNYKGKEINYSKESEEIKRCIEMGKNINFVLASHITDFSDVELLNIWRDHWLEFAKEHKNLSAVHVNPYINPWGQLIKQKNAIHFDACPYADGEHLFIGVTGNVVPCCMDLEEEIQFGNVLTDSREEIMERRQTFYEQIRKGAATDLCKRCLK